MDKPARIELPGVIYLNFGNEPMTEEEKAAVCQHGEVTWCADQQEVHDVAYVRVKGVLALLEKHFRKPNGHWTSAKAKACWDELKKMRER